MPQASGRCRAQPLIAMREGPLRRALAAHCPNVQ